ncbi:ATP-dependent DNA helicase [Aquabacterium sp.]|uniref:ATP-dependent DNA helicase n=1 Tax=Aquabacterium sp. TaxID=1872578 RepID=UPI002C7D688C|nr:ATP-dependent DNA helicase [Aquabacterium sp.]HSW05339.1 ATP-dependent DNA helicase [Aquabacterium sp.]
MREVLPSTPVTADATAAAAAAAAPGWHYTVSVRALCEFTAKRGDLDRRFTPTATALEGLQGQQTVANRRGQDYETEIALEGLYGALRIRGRADGYDPRRRCLEEIKTIRGHPDEIPENRRQLHWAQLQCYGALFCRARGLAEIALALVYFDVAAQTEVELRQVFGAEELDQIFAGRCAAFLAWAQQEAEHRRARDAALQALAFPKGTFRAGQRDLAAAAYRAAANGRCLLAQAPTGIGKTVGTLFPLLRAMPAHGIDKLAYLTCKGTGRLPALEALQALRAGAAGQALRVLAMVPKTQACEHPDKACHGDACPLARGFYERLPAAREEAVAEGWLDAAAQRRIALRHGICPYYLGQELLRWADVLVGDVQHLFDSSGQLWGLMQALNWQLAVLVDEAHNLVERTRQMYSAELQLSQIRTAAKVAPAMVSGPLHGLLQATEDLVADAAAPYAVLEAVPDAYTQALQAAVGALSEHFHQHPLSLGPLLNFFFELQRFLRLVEALSDHSLFDVQTLARERSSAGDVDADAAAADGVLCVRNVAPACFLRQRFRDLHSVTLFSATLSPPDYAIRLLGLPENTAWIDVPPAFPAEHLSVQVADGISTRFAHRDKSLQRLVDVIARQFDAHPGNYLAFFSSFDYLDKAASLLALRRADITQWRQDRRMGAAARQDFLARFDPQGQGIAFAVLGGVFAEGVDLPGAKLIGAFIATLGLPPVSATQDQITARMDKLFGAEHGYADLIPAMQKVVQAAGRVLRTPEDRGWLWLLDDRYRRGDVAALLPPWWGPGTSAP